MKRLVLKGSFLVPIRGITLPMFLAGLMLHGKESRERTRFIKMLEPRILEIEQERIKTLEKYSKKNKDGKPLYYDKDRKETSNSLTGMEYIVEDIKGYNKEFDEYLNEEYVLDITPATSSTIYTVRELLLNTDKEFSTGDAENYNEWCEAFEGIKEND